MLKTKFDINFNLNSVSSWISHLILMLHAVNAYMLKYIASKIYLCKLPKIFLMKHLNKNIKLKKTILKDYNRIVVTREHQTVNLEWSYKGDNFQKLSIYNKSYKTIPTLVSNIGTTILLKDLK